MGRFGRANLPQKPVIDDVAGTAAIPLFRVDGTHVLAMLDLADLDLVAGYRWWESRRPDGLTSYALATAGSKADRRVIVMHRLLADAPEGMHVDHADGDGLNNRRGNIRLATPSQNAANKVNRRASTSPYRGTHWVTKEQVWRAYIGVDGSVRFLGHFDDAISAALAYDDAARLQYGEFARTNFTVEEAANLSRGPRRRRVAKHGLSRALRTGCRCTTCGSAWRRHRDVENQKARTRRAEKRAA